MEIWRKTLKLGILLTLFSINCYADPLDVVKPEINRVTFFSGKWHINYNELKNGTNLLKEELFIDGNSDRIVTIGTKEKRGFPLHGTYDRDVCHKAYVVVYDKAHNIVTKSDVFNFGDTTKCDVPEPADTVDPVITLSGKTPQVLTKGQVYEELGAIALDNRDGELTNKITIDSSKVDTSIVGDYTVSYDVIDAAGNDATTVTRIVKVVAEDFMGELEIHKIKFHGAKWYINYQDLRKVKGLKSEKLFVDGDEVRTVTGGYSRPFDRGFSFVGAYAQNACHEAYIIAYDVEDKVLAKSAVFKFGKCKENSSVYKILNVKYFNKRWNISYADVAVSLAYSKEKVYVNGVLDRTVNAGTTDAKLRRGFRLLGAYAKDKCHEAYIELYSRKGTKVKTTESFNFGNLSNCGKDMVKPVITLVGDSNISLTLGSTYVELGAMVTDDVDGNITSDLNITSNINMAVAGIYRVRYNIKDSAGNEAIEVNRTVTIKKVNCVLTEEMEDQATGLFTATLNWQNPLADLEMTNPLMVKQGKSCTSFAMGSADLTLFSVYPGHYPIVIDVNNTTAVTKAQLPDQITLDVTTPGEGKILQTEIATIDDYYKLGHIADIWVWRPKENEPPIIMSLPTARTSSNGWSYNGWSFGTRKGSDYTWYSRSTRGDYSSGSRRNSMVTNVEQRLCKPAQSCGCKPCEYGVLEFLNQVNLGPISGGTYRIYKATEFGKENIDYLYEAETSIGDELDKAGIMEFPTAIEGRPLSSAEQIAFMQKLEGYEGDFIIEVTGGIDIDKDSNWKVDDSYTPLNGTAHSIISKEQLLGSEYKVNILTELAFQVSQDLLGEGYDQVQLESRLNAIAQKVLIEKLYPYSEKSLGRDDLTYWMPNANKNWLVKDYTSVLHPIVNKLHSGAYLKEEANEFIYGEIKTTTYKLPILGSATYYIDESQTGEYLVGSVNVLSEGASAITSYNTDAHYNFRIDNDGKIYLIADATLDYEKDNQYSLFVTATNAEGISRPVVVWIMLNDVVDAPSFVEFKGGTIAEDAEVGAYVGEVVYNENASAIEGYVLSGPDKDEFDIDKRGVIRVGVNAQLDYESFYGKRLTVTAYNAEGTSSVTKISVQLSSVLEVSDVPTIESKEVHILENATKGTVVAELNITSSVGVPIKNIALLGDDSRIFSISTDGKVRLLDNTSIDYETKVDYLLGVVATNANGVSRPASLHIIVDDVNDVPALGSSSHSVHYNASANTLIGSINVLNAGASAITTYTLGGEASSNFTVNKRGKIFLKGSNNLSSYQKATLYLSVTATNALGTSLNARVSIFVESDLPFLGGLRTYVDENAPNGTTLGSITIRSLTAITSARLTGNGSENFAISNRGVISLVNNSAIDYEQRTSYDLLAFVTNLAGESQGTAVHVAVSDIADTIKIRGFSSSVYEDSSVGSLIGTVPIVYLGGKTLDHFELVGEGASNFSVSSDRKVKIASVANFNSSTTPHYRLALVAIATDGERSNEVYLDISVAKSINTVPQITALSVTLDENPEIGSFVGQLHIVSQTRVVDSVWFEGEGKDDFTVDTKGRISIKKSLDFERQSSYALRVFALNALGRSVESRLTVSVNNLLDDEPQLSDSTLSVNENAPVGTVVGSVSILSNGSSPITNMILVGSGKENFVVSSAGVVSTVTVLDFESILSYALEVKAVNTKAESALVNLLINVNNVPEVKPIVDMFTGYVDENATAGTELGAISFVTGGDSPITAYILTGVGSKNFVVENGIVKVSAVADLNESIQKDYNLSMTAINGFGASDKVMVTIVVTSDKVKPSVPSGLKILDISDSSLTLGWSDESENKRGFNLYRDGVKVVLDQNVTSYSIAGLESERSYHFVLKAFNDKGESEGISIDAVTSVSIVIAERTSIIKKTAQTVAYANYDDGYYELGLAFNYTKENENILDRVTGLVWQDNSSTNGSTKTWSEAQGYCDELGDAWRLPTRKELSGLVQYDRYHPSINKAFKYSTSDYYWTKSMSKRDVNKVWVVSFSEGVESIGAKTSSYSVRCVKERGSLVANAGVDQVVKEGKTFTLVGSDTPSNKSITQYSWSENGQELGNTATLNINTLRGGIHHITLTIYGKDASSDSDSDELIVTIVSNDTIIKQSGQKTSYARYDDGHYQKGISFNYTQKGEDILDRATGLVWQDSDDTNGSRKSWSEAKKYCDELEGANWRLPTRKELSSLIHYDVYHPSIDKRFKHTKSDYYWTLNTKNRGDDSPAWVVSFSEGVESTGSKQDSYYTRCVQSDFALTSNAGVDQIVEEGQPVILHATESPREEFIRSYVWFEGDVELGEGAELELHEMINGTHIITLLTTDEAGNENRDTLRVTIVLNNKIVKKTMQGNSYAKYDDGYYGKGIVLNYSKKSKGVLDRATGLIWQESEETNTTKQPWEEANNYCSSLKGNWRLPTRKELSSLVRYDYINPSTDKIFAHTASDYYWTINGSIRDRKKAWVVSFSEGVESTGVKTTAYHTRCVQSNFMPTANAGVDIFIEKGKEVILNAINSPRKNLIDSYLWASEEDELGYEHKVTLNNLLSGRRKVFLTITDKEDRTDTDDLWVTIVLNGTIVKKTNQTGSYANYDDGYYEKGASLSYSDHGNTVTDDTTALEWRDDETTNSVKMTWKEANDYCGQEGNVWRLPTRRELSSLVDYGRYNPSIESSFDNTASDYYWTANSSKRDDKNAWAINFSEGVETTIVKNGLHFVRCINAN